MKILLLFSCFFLGRLISIFAQADSTYTLADTALANQYLKEARGLTKGTPIDSVLKLLAQSSRIYERTIGTENKEYADVLFEKGKRLYWKTDYEPALEFSQRCLDLRLKVLGPEHVDVTKSWNLVGQIYHAKGNYEKAIVFEQKALAIYLKVLGPEHPDVAGIYHSMGASELSHSNLGKAMDYFQKALAINLKNFGPESDEVAKSYLNLGAVESSNRHFDKSLEYSHKSLAIKLKLFGPDGEGIALLYSNMGFVYFSKGDYDHALDYFHQSLDILYRQLEPEHLDFAIRFFYMGIVYRNKGEYEKAFEYTQKALRIRLKKFGPMHPSVANSYEELGTVYYQTGDYKHALEYFRKSLDMMAITVGPEHPAVGELYDRLAGVFNSMGDYDRAIEYYQRAQDILIKALGPDHPDTGVSFLNMGVVYINTGDLDRALEYQQKALEIFLRKSGPENPAIPFIYNNLSVIYRLKGDLETALEYARKTLEIRLLRLGPGHPEMGRCYDNLGLISKNKGDYVQALTYFQTALDIRQQAFGTEHPDVATSWTKLGVVLKEQHKFTEAAHCFDQSLKALGYAGAGSLAQVNSIPDLFECLRLKGDLYQNWYKQTQNLTYLDTARQIFFAAAATVDYQHKTLQNPGSKYTLASAAASVFEGAIATDYLLRQVPGSLNDIREAFDYAEKSKSLILYGAMQEASALRFAGIPDSLLQLEYDLRIDITFHEKKRQETLRQGLSITDSSFLAVSSKLFGFNQRYETLKKRFERDFPDYYRLRYDLSTAGVTQVQDELLQTGQTLLEYVVGDSSIFIFVVREKSMELVAVNKDFPLETWVCDLRKNLLENRSTGAGEYCELAYRLYQKLLAPVKVLLTEDLIIIPDGVLGYLPFEALLTQKPDKPIRFDRHKYVLNDYRISYCYSATLLREMMQQKDKDAGAQTPLAAFAPYYSGDTTLLAGLFPTAEFRKDLQALQYSGEEVSGIQKMFGGEVFYGATATVARFLEKAGTARILHLATHGKANDLEGDYSFLAFSDRKDSLENEILYVRDLYNMRLNAALVTLSACETGIGKLQRGEGIISLARAFTYAGARSIVTSLWSVNDEQTKDLMLLFYKGLQQNLPKNEALRQAKINLSKRPGAHPFFWAGFIAIGDMRPLNYKH